MSTDDRSEVALPETDQALQDTMSKMEAALLAPLVSGELQSWVKSVIQAAATFSTDWTRYLHTVLHPQYSEISKEDPELATPVAKMIATDSALMEKLAAFHDKLHELSQRAVRVGNHESRLEEMRKEVESEGIAIILGIKKQITAARTWFAEALLRDRGVGD